MSSDLVHIMGLSPRQQAALSIVLHTTLMSMTDKIMADILNNPTNDTISAKRAVIKRIISTFYDINSMLCSPNDISRGRPKILMFNDTAINSISSALNSFAPPYSYLSKDDIDDVNRELAGLKKLVQESLQYVYTEDEIKTQYNKKKASKK